MTIGLERTSRFKTMFDMCCAARSPSPKGGRPTQGARSATVGVGWFFQAGQFSVAQVVPGGPAALCGQIASGDVLMAVDGHLPVDTNHLRSLVTGPPGSEVELILQAPYGGPEKRVRLVRRVLQDPSASAPPQDHPQPVATRSSDGFSSRPGTMADAGSPYSATSTYGVGINFYRSADGLFCIESMCCGYPATSILSPHDVLVAVDGLNVEHASPDQVLKCVRGARGTQCTLTFRRRGGGEPFQITLGRFYAVV